MAAKYDAQFYDDLQDTQIPSARALVPFLSGIINPASAVDVGCGRGFWLREFAQNGAADVFGIDGPWVPTEKLAIAKERFRATDLDKSFTPGRTFDIAISLEVAEHLQPERAKGFIDDICKLAPVVLFGAAIPGQGGTGHYNEQWPSYWARLFAANNFLAYDIVRPRIWTNDTVTWWYKQNVILYVQEKWALQSGRMDGYHPTKADEIAALIHPELFNKKLREASPGFGKWLRHGRKALMKSLRKRSPVAEKKIQSD